MAVVPILLGYCLFGVIVFACVSDRFGSVTTAAISLFAVLNGDRYALLALDAPLHRALRANVPVVCLSVRETMLDLDHQTDGPLMSFVLTVYMYSFCCIFIYLALMCFVAIVEEAFFQTRCVVAAERLWLIPPDIRTPLCRRRAGTSLGCTRRTRRCRRTCAFCWASSDASVSANLRSVRRCASSCAKSCPTTAGTMSMTRPSLRICAALLGCMFTV